jgi:hypothetical protein
MSGWEIIVIPVLIGVIALWIWLAKWVVKQVSLAIKSKKFSAKLVGAVLLLPILVVFGFSFLVGFLGS